MYCEIKKTIKVIKFEIPVDNSDRLSNRIDGVKYVHS